jgi:GNAT superfamily N-acetyltransferase
MENAINFMEQDQNVDLSILCADPRGHAKKIYWRLGYTYTTYLSVALKIISIRNTLKKFTLFFPFALPLRLYASLKTKRRKKKYKENLTFAVLGKDQDEFRQKLNENYSSIFYSFNEFDQKYWDWYHIQRPKSHESIAIAAKENGKIIAGGVITKSYLMVLNTKKWVPLFILTELFVQKPYQKRGIGSYLLARLEEVAKRRGVPGILIHFHGRNAALRTLLKKMGYLCMNKVTLQMIKPISERAKEHFQQIQGKKFVWKIPWEQMGF